MSDGKVESLNMQRRYKPVDVLPTKNKDWLLGIKGKS